MSKTDFVAWKPFEQTTYVSFPRMGFKIRYLKACIYIDKQVLIIMANN